MNKEQENTLYARWLAGDISPAEEEQLRASDEWTELEKIKIATDLLSLPAYDTEAGYQRFRREKAVRRPTAKVRRLPIVRILSIAAGVAALVVAGIFLLQNPDTEVLAQQGSIRTYTLPDDSQVILNDGSSVVFNTSDWETERSLQLRGEALFEVAKGRTFSVQTNSGVVEVLGTKFNVRAWNEQLSVACYEGRVAIKSGGKEQTIVGGQSVRLINGTLGSPQPITEQQPSWKNGRSRFERADAVEVFGEIERQFAVKVELPAGFSQRFTGSFEHKDLESALRAVCLPLSLDYEIIDNTVRLRYRSE